MLQVSSNRESALLGSLDSDLRPTYATTILEPSYPQVPFLCISLMKPDASEPSAVTSPVSHRHKRQMDTIAVSIHAAPVSAVEVSAADPTAELAPASVGPVEADETMHNAIEFLTQDDSASALVFALVHDPEFRLATALVSVGRVCFRND